MINFNWDEMRIMKKMEMKWLGMVDEKTESYSDFSLYKMKRKKRNNEFL